MSSGLVASPPTSLPTRRYYRAAQTSSKPVGAAAPDKCGCGAGSMPGDVSEQESESGETACRQGGTRAQAAKRCEANRASRYSGSL
jgi:hypothetical protein